VKVVIDPVQHMVQDMFYRILMSDIEDKPFSMICPNQWPGTYSAVANMLNKFNVSARNVHAFAMDEWADEDGNVAPLTYGAGLGYSFMNHFYGRIREDLRPPVDHWHVHTNETKGTDVFSNIIDAITGGGVDVVYTATGWPGHTAFIDPGAPEFAADSLEEFITLGSRITTCTPLTIVENESIWRVIPRWMAYRLIPKSYHARMKKLFRKSTDHHPMEYRPDYTPDRIWRVLKNHVGNCVRFNKYCKKPGN